MNQEQEFEAELEIFRKDAESAAQYFYAYLAMDELAKHKRSVLGYLNRNGLFWCTVASALQISAVIALHRVLHTTKHNVGSLLDIAQKNIGIFSKPALRLRKKGNAKTEPAWLKVYMRDVYVPGTQDFRRIRAKVDRYQKIYQANYKGVRDRVFAHRIPTKPSDIEALLSRTNIREMERMIVFLLRLYGAFQELYDNGRKPVLRRMRYSAKRMSSSSSAGGRSGGVHERIAREVEQVLLAATARR